MQRPVLCPRLLILSIHRIAEGIVIFALSMLAISPAASSAEAAGSDHVAFLEIHWPDDLVVCPKSPGGSQVRVALYGIMFPKSTQVDTEAQVSLVRLLRDICIDGFVEIELTGEKTSRGEPFALLNRTTSPKTSLQYLLVSRGYAVVDRKQCEKIGSKLPMDLLFEAQQQARARKYGLWEKNQDLMQALTKTGENSDGKEHPTDYEVNTLHFSPCSAEDFNRYNKMYGDHLKQFIKNEKLEEGHGDQYGEPTSAEASEFHGVRVVGFRYATPNEESKLLGDREVFVVEGEKPRCVLKMRK